LERLNAYRILWILVFYDLPTETKLQRKKAALFRKRILKNGFNMFQFSMYIRHCPSRENSEVHLRRVRSILPEEGHVGIMVVTDRQFGQMELYFSRDVKEKPEANHQLEMF
jgi:CRISPR-associated protein Cas2